jgi:hypothetical protein
MNNVTRWVTMVFPAPERLRRNGLPAKKIRRFPQLRQYQNVHEIANNTFFEVVNRQKKVTIYSSGKSVYYPCIVYSEPE